MSDPRGPVDLEALLARLPHAPPMRLVERLIAVDPGRSVTASRRAAPGDWYFRGHFPSAPVVPAIVLIELMAQAGGLAAASGSDGDVGGMRLAAVANCKFPAPAGPGSELVVTAHVRMRMGSLVRVDGSVAADGVVVATGSVTLVALERERAVP